MLLLLLLLWYLHVCNSECSNENDRCVQRSQWQNCEKIPYLVKIVRANRLLIYLPCYNIMPLLWTDIFTLEWMDELRSECFVTAVFCACKEVCVYFCLLYLVLAFCCTGILTLAILTFGVGAVGKCNSLYEIWCSDDAEYVDYGPWDVILYFGRKFEAACCGTILFVAM